MTFINKSICFLVFSGYNERAVWALCRFFSQRKISFYIVARDKYDRLIYSPWSERIVLVRYNKDLNIKIFKKIVERIKIKEKVDKIIYCPTTEFLNKFVLDNREELEYLDINVPLPERKTYSLLTNKISNTAFFEKIGIESPKIYSLKDAILLEKCVFKPRKNIVNNRTLYPIICLTKKDIYESRKKINEKIWFVQEFIKGQSLYLCMYVRKNGLFCYFWQANLLQQPNGKSIVLARSIDSPKVVSENLIADSLHQLGFYGPIMIEFIIDESGVPKFIEANPRFWGPLQLAIDTCPQIINNFIFESIEGEDSYTDADELCSPLKINWYAWHDEIVKNLSILKRYPLVNDLTDEEIIKISQYWDVYSGTKYNR